ncbi:MAG TPA: MFS transporter [Streptosporangiaceae bacterium]
MNLGWRLCFALGVVFALVILLVRRHVPESPRWMFIHGRQQAAESLVDGIEDHVTDGHRERLAEAGDSITVRQHESVSLVTIAKTMFRSYPRRTTLGLSLFIGQAFLYNAITFGFAQILATFFHVTTNPGCYFAVMAVGNLLGPLLLGRFFDTFGRKPMIVGTYSTAAGGISGPLLFSSLVSTGKVSDTVIAFSIGAVLMIPAGLVEIVLGVKAERRGLEDIATPLTAQEAGQA